MKVAKSKKVAKKDIEKFAKKVISRYTDSIIEAVFSKIKSDPELNKEYFDLCGLGDMVEVVPVKPAEKKTELKKAIETKKPKAVKKAIKKVVVAEKAKEVKKAVIAKKPKAVKKAASTKKGK